MKDISMIEYILFRFDDSLMPAIFKTYTRHEISPPLPLRALLSQN